MKFRLYLITLFFLSFFPFSFGQNGSIEGTITDEKTGESLFGTTVVIDGTSIGATTDIDGKFKLGNVRPGTYTIKVSYISYSPGTIDKVRVEPGKTTTVKATLKENTIALGDITVTALKRTNTEMSMISEVKASSFVSIGISGQQISKTLDKDASEVIRRVPGITIQSDRFVIVRGLAERYNNVWLNNSATPSSEADVRAFSFDIIPSSVIDNIMIIKSPVAELPSDFSGGFVKISTKNMPDKNSFLFSYGTALHEGTTFQKFNSYDNGSWTDLLGFDNGARDLPADMPDHLNQYESATNPEVKNKITQLGREMDNTWLPVEKTSLPEQKFLLGFNRRFDKGKRQIGNTAAVTYARGDNSESMRINDYTIYDYINDKPSYINQFNDRQFTNSTKVGIMYNWAFLLNKNNKVEFRNLFNQSGYKRSTFREGNEWYNDGRLIRSEEMRYLSRSIYTGQLAGDHTLNESGSAKIDWIAGYSYSAKNEPDTKRYKYIQDQQNPDQFLLLFGDQADLSSVSRMWINLHENTISTALNLTVRPVIGSIRPEIKTGIYFEDKARSFNARNFGYAKGSSLSSFGKTTLPVNEIFVDENINLTDGIKLSEVTALSDSYTAGNLQMAGYLSGKIPLARKFNLYAGLRLERNKQTLSSYRQGTSIEVEVNRDTINLFPSANLTYNINEKNLIRAAYGMSVNRPEFREIAPFYYVDFEMNAGVYGAPEIRQAYVHNFDLRYEMYPENGQTFSIGAFYKTFNHPIEQVILGNNPTQYSFENVESAYSYGVEAELRRNLDFIPALKNFTLVMNGSLIKSQVQFAQGSLSRNRPLEGQSPYIINAGLFYQGENNGLMMSLLYNVIGKRIVAVGRPSPNQWEDIPDIYEMPRNAVDFAFSKSVGKHFEIKGGIKDILNQPVKYQQNVNTSVDMALYSQGADSGFRYFDRHQVTRTFSPGRTVQIGVSVKF